jgi:hydroxylamine oxidation protein HaoB
LGIALLLLGSAILLDAIWSPAFRFERTAVLATETLMRSLMGAFPIEKLTRYTLRHGSDIAVELTVADYRDAHGTARRVILFPDRTGDGPEGPGPRTAQQARHDLWQAAAEAITKHTGERALILSWWDDAQRVRFLTGRETWLDRPVAAAFPDGNERTFWREVSGGFASGDELRQWARWLTMEANAAITEMKSRLPQDRAVYLLVCLDTLARSKEIEALSGVHLPFEAAVFPAGSDLHRQIARVKRWAREKGDFGYLVQQIPELGIRAWRITTKQGQEMLLARLLPFHTSLARSLPRLPIVYQTGWGSYLTIYALHPGNG